MHRWSRFARRYLIFSLRLSRIQEHIPREVPENAAWGNFRSESGFSQACHYSIDQEETLIDRSWMTRTFKLFWNLNIWHFKFAVHKHSFSPSHLIKGGQRNLDTAQQEKRALQNLLSQKTNKKTRRPRDTHALSKACLCVGFRMGPGRISLVTPARASSSSSLLQTYKGKSSHTHPCVSATNSVAKNFIPAWLGSIVD